jgi:sugar (pentulose or hexulose) kinase
MNNLEVTNLKHRTYLAFDYGSSSAKVRIAGFDGKKIKLKNIYGFENNPVQAGSYLQWDILRLYHELCNGIRIAFKKYSSIESIGIDAWGGDFGFIDKKGYLIGNPVHYRNFHCEKSEEIFKSLYSVIPKIEIFKSTGIQFSIPGCNLYQIHSLVLSKSKILAIAFKYLMIPDLLNYFLTGIIAAEYTVNGMSQLMDQGSRKWSYYIMDKIGIPKNIFPEIIQPGTLLGSANQTALNFINCPKFKVIAPVEHDTSSAFYSVPYLKNYKLCTIISIGSWSVLGIKINNQILTKEAFNYGFSNQAGPDGCFYFFKNMTGLWPAQECRKKIILKDGKEISWDEIDLMVEKAEMFKCFINIDNPLFGRIVEDMKKEILCYLKNTEQGTFESNGELFRCIFESIVLRFRYNIELLEIILNEKIDCIYLIGGGSKNKTICQFTANLLNIPVVSGIFDASSLGNIISQMVASREINTFKEGQELIKKSINLLEYYPEEAGKWEIYYKKYVNFIKKYEM